MSAEPPSRVELSAILAAVGWGFEVHQGQRRRGLDAPYVSHPLAVAALVLEDGGDELAVIAALLHDTVEHGGGRPVLAGIRGEFGDEVADAVEACSDAVDESRASWADRKADHVERWRAEVVPVRALTVAAADKLHNVWALLEALRLEGPSAWESVPATANEVIDYYTAMAGLLADRCPGSRNAQRLHLAVSELERYRPEPG